MICKNYYRCQSELKGLTHQRCNRKEYTELCPAYSQQEIVKETGSQPTRVTSQIAPADTHTLETCIEKMRSKNG